ncbi:hypothetical protein ACFX1W_008837 [Malus domestica]
MQPPCRCHFGACCVLVEYPGERERYLAGQTVHPESLFSSSFFFSKEEEQWGVVVDDEHRNRRRNRASKQRPLTKGWVVPFACCQWRGSGGE